MKSMVQFVISNSMVGDKFPAELPRLLDISGHQENPEKKTLPLPCCLDVLALEKNVLAILSD
jgi:hypothetical protein